MECDGHLSRPKFPRVTNGREISRKEAGRCVVECYERMVRFYGLHHPDD